MELIGVCKMSVDAEMIQSPVFYRTKKRTEQTVDYDVKIAAVEGHGWKRMSVADARLMLAAYASMPIEAQLIFNSVRPYKALEICELMRDKKKIRMS